MAEEETTRYSTKIPTFGGQKKDWMVFKVKLESYLAQKDMAALLSYTGEIPLDTEVWTADELATAEIQEKVRIRAMNTKAAGILLGCIVDTDTKKGKSAFELVSKQISASRGYAGGHFKNAWASMKKRYEDKGTMTTSELQKAYYDLTMKEGESPDDFVVSMELARKKLLEDAEIEIEEQQFLLDILSRLPKGETEKNFGPYQMIKRFLEPKIRDANDAFDLDDLVLELMKVHKDVYGDEDDDDDDKDTPGEKAFVGYAKNQFKGRCYKCGKMGHKGSECRSGGNSGHKNHGPKNNKNDKFKGECHYCHKVGHKQEDCFKKKSDLAARGENANKAAGRKSSCNTQPSSFHD
jgi:gag-polypeptide of LTR copia-type